MMCHDCQPLLLDHLYGLLEAAETAAVESHLAGCPACTAARSEAARAQGLIGKAAKSSFPHVRFAAPLEEATVPAPAVKKPAKRSYLGWVVAASVLALIPGTLVPLSKLSGRYDSAKRETEESFTRLADAGTAYQLARNDTAAQARLDAASAKQKQLTAEWSAAEKAAQSRVVTVGVKKPISAQPGAPNEYVVAIADPTESLRDRRVEAQFRDQTGAVLFSQNIDPKKEASIRLPAEVWSRVKPQSDVYLSVTAVNAAGERTEIQEPIRLFGPVYATMLVTDKATYHPGDRLYFRSLTLDRITFRPPNREQKLQYVLRKQDDPTKPLQVLTGSTRIVKETDGVVETVLDSNGQPIRGVGCGAFVLPAGLVDGDYVLTLTELAGPNGMPPVMAYPVNRAIQVRSGAPERFAKKITFAGTSYAPGQAAVAYVELKLGDKPVIGAKGLVTVVTESATPAFIQVSPQAKNGDNNPIPYTGLTDENGRFKITISLRANMPRGDVKLMVTFSHDGANESVAERVPIAGTETIVEFFPEGGKLIAGVPNRVYVRGTNANGKPIDVRGTIALGNEIVAKVDSITDEHPGANRGLGSFTFTPKADASYRLRLQSLNPTGIAPSFELPKAENDGVAFTALDTVTTPGQPIRLRVHSVGKNRNLVIGAYTRGQIADTQKVAVKAGTPAIVTLLAKSDARGGVTRVTVFEEPADKNADLIPVAERLVFRKPGELLNLTASAGTTTSFAPGSAIDLSVAATDEKGNPVPAILWAAAVNTAVAPGTKDRMMPTHFLLAGEVQTPDELEHADFLLTDHPKAAESLDHVLATQGWRRFVEQGQTNVVPGTPAAQHLKLNGQKAPAPKAGVNPISGPLAERYWPRIEESVREVSVAQKGREAQQVAVSKSFEEYAEAQSKVTEQSRSVQAVAEPLNRLRDRLTYAVGSVAALTILAGLLALVRGAGLLVAAPYLLGTLASSGLTVHFATSDLAQGMDEVQALSAPASSENGPAPKMVALPPVPPDAVENDLSDEPSAEPYKISILNVPVPMVNPASIKRPDPKRTIPSDLLDPKVVKTLRAPLPEGVLSALLASDSAARAKAEAFAYERAKALLQKVEAADSIRSAVPRTAPLVIREYAAPRPGAKDAHDSDTVLWQPVIVLPSDGKTTLRFNLGNAPSGYQVIVAGHTLDGRIGSVRTVLPVAPVR